MKKHFVGLDLGGTKLAAALFLQNDDTGALEFCRALKPLKYGEIFNAVQTKPLPPAERGKKIEEAMISAVEKLTAGIDGGLEALGVATAGFVEKGIVKDASNIGIKVYPLRTR
ncbi:MAG: hypothetical protein AB1546_02465, partial [bacterium]